MSASPSLRSIYRTGLRFGRYRQGLSPLQRSRPRYVNQFRAFSSELAPGQPNLQQHHPESANVPQSKTKQGKTFKELFETSKFARMVDPVGREVEGEVIAVTEEHLYIDFGFKFHGVVDKPTGNENLLSKGSRVVVLVNDLEVTEHFQGASKHTSLLEADIELKGYLDHKDAYHAL